MVYTLSFEITDGTPTKTQRSVVADGKESYRNLSIDKVWFPKERRLQEE